MASTLHCSKRPPLRLPTRTQYCIQQQQAHYYIYSNPHPNKPTAGKTTEVGKCTSPNISTGITLRLRAGTNKGINKNTQHGKAKETGGRLDNSEVPCISVRYAGMRYSFHNV